MRFVAKRSAGSIAVLDLEATAALMRAKALISDCGVALEPCFYFEDARLADGSLLSERVAELGPKAAACEAAEVEAIAAATDTEGAATGATASGGESPGGGGGGERPGAPAAQRGAGPTWAVVGGGAAGGVLVREGESTASPASGRLSCGARVEQLELRGGRLRFRRLAGSGPGSGWISTWASNKALAVRLPSPRPAAPVAREGPGPVALVFPWEGCQHRKMLQSSHKMPVVRAMLEKAAAILGYDLLELCLHGPEFRLARTRFAQPAVFFCSLVALEKLKSQRPELVARASAMAGLGVGHYAALCAAGVLSFEDGLKIVHRRGEAMEEAFRMGDQLMATCLGLDEAVLRRLCTEAAKEEGPTAVCEIAHRAFRRGYAVSGTARAVELLKQKAKGAGALLVREVNTTVASESRLMQPAWGKLAAALAEVRPKMRPPQGTVWTTTTRGPLHPGCRVEDVVDDLEAHLTQLGDWEGAIQGMLKDGIRDFCLLGPKSVLKTTLLRIDRSLLPGIHHAEGRHAW